MRALKYITFALDDFLELHYARSHAYPYHSKRILSQGSDQSADCAQICSVASGSSLSKRYSISRKYPKSENDTVLVAYLCHEDQK